MLYSTSRSLGCQGKIFAAACVHGFVFGKPELGRRRRSRGGGDRDPSLERLFRVAIKGLNLSYQNTDANSMKAVVARIQVWIK